MRGRRAPPEDSCDVPHDRRGPPSGYHRNHKGWRIFESSRLAGQPEQPERPRPIPRCLEVGAVSFKRREISDALKDFIEAQLGRKIGCSWRYPAPLTFFDSDIANAAVPAIHSQKKAPASRALVCAD
jgi:hypothetical protein